MILIAEDDEDDREFIKLAFKKAATTQSLQMASNGQEVLDCLGKLPEKEFPCLIVLDLNMPVLDGLQTLEALNEKPDFRKIPKVIFTTSGSDEDKARCLSKGASDYFVKPHNMSEIVKTVETMLRYCN
ncbi:MAG TPA: response regulator [Chitinophagaceae bacterium]|nr:response regulator [Chitinophagaceae bacterium]